MFRFSISKHMWKVIRILAMEKNSYVLIWLATMPIIGLLNKPMNYSENFVLFYAPPNQKHACFICVNMITIKYT